VCLYFFYPERASACYTICEPITGIFPNEYVKKEDVTMLTRDVVAFLLCLLGAVLGPYTLALVKKNPSLLQMLATLVFSGGSLVFYYYSFDNVETPLLPILYYGVVVGAALFFYYKKNRSNP
jgi:drug/metabolite transporter (DMT)-like permease